MSAVLWWIVGIYLAVGTVLLIVNALPHAQESAVLRFSASVGVPLPQRLGERLRRRMLINRRSTLIGGMVGILVTALIVGSRTTSTPDLFGTFILVAGAFAGPALANSIAALLTSPEDSGGQVRYARSHAVELSDYVPPVERVLARGVTLLAVGVFAALTISSAPRPADNPTELLNSAVITLIAVGTLLIFEIAGRRIVAMGNRASSPEELVWEDAIRSLTARALTSAPALVGLYAILWSAPALAPGGSGQGLQSSMGLIVAFGVVVVVIIAAMRKPEQYFLQRLWPELAAEAGSRPTEATP